MSQHSLRICFLSNSMGVGGTDRQILYIAHALQDRGHDVKIISLRPPREMGRKAERNGLAYESLQIEGSIPHPTSIPHLYSCINDFDPDVLCCFLYHANILGRVIGTLQNVPVVVTSIRNEDFGGTLRERVTRLTDRLDDMVTTNSETVADSLVERGVVKPGKIETIHNAIDADEFDVSDEEAVNRNTLSVAEKMFLWITVGRLNDQKDHETLLQAVAQIETDKPFQLLIVGDGKKREELTELSRTLDVEEQVLFLGERQDVPALLGAADGFVLSSAWEGLPNVVMEALTAGLPVVSTDVGGVSELVEESESGYLVAKQSPDALANAMDRLMNCEAVDRKQMGERGREHVRSQFSIEDIVDKWEGLFVSHLSESTITGRVN